MKQAINNVISLLDSNGIIGGTAIDDLQTARDDHWIGALDFIQYIANCSSSEINNSPLSIIRRARNIVGAVLEFDRDCEENKTLQLIMYRPYLDDE